MNLLLHDKNFARILLNGHRVQRWIRARAADVYQATAEGADPDVSIIIRSRNDGRHIKRLFDDIAAQIFEGKIEVIVVDTESSDETAAHAASRGAQVISIKQKEFTYPKALNIGFQAASHPWILTLVGHSSLSNRMLLKSLTYWNSREPELGGIYGLPLANWNASRWERLENVIAPRAWKYPTPMTKLSIGIMGANCSIVKRKVWEKFGGYDERFAAGGEDRAFAQTMLDHGILIVREPLCSVFHSHGLSIQNSVRQWLHWGEVGKKALPFDTARVHHRRPDLR